MRLDRRRLQSTCASGDDELNRARHRIVRDHAVEVRDLQLLAHRLHHLPRLNVVDAADDEIHRRLAVEGARIRCVLELLLVAALVDCNVDVMHLKRCVGVEFRAVVPARHRLVPAGLFGPIEHLVHVRKLNGIKVVDDDLADPNTCEHLGDTNTDAANTDQRDREVAHAVKVLNNTHALERHQPRVGICVHWLGIHRFHLLPTDAARPCGR
mmetsp:Transcript_1188/g.2505  ORF Transcript_1188/g.2505 Transcript_1188/m.2505 type:complete len:211 (-) Transcript_1188:183-815(-)